MDVDGCPSKVRVAAHILKCFIAFGSIKGIRLRKYAYIAWKHFVCRPLKNQMRNGWIGQMESQGNGLRTEMDGMPWAGESRIISSQFAYFTQGNEKESIRIIAPSNSTTRPLLV